MLHDTTRRLRAAARHEERAARRLCAPTLALMFVLLVLPCIAVLALSLTDAELGASEWNFIGLAAYGDLFADRDFRRAFVNTALYVGLVAPASVILGLGLALLIESGTWGRTFFRSIFFLPVVSLIVAMATAWQYLMHPTIGPINLILAKMNLPAVNWLGSSGTVLVALAIIGVWQATGFNMVLYLAGLTSIDRTLYQAAEIDGARSAWDRFKLVTWPMLSPVTLFVTTISVINAVKVFETVAALTQGGPAKSSDVLLWSIYQEGFVYLHIGSASAMAVVFVAVLLVLIIAQTRIQERRVQYQ